MLERRRRVHHWMALWNSRRVVESAALEGLAGSLEAFESAVEAVEAASAEVLGAAVGNSRILAVAKVVATERSHVQAADPESLAVLAAMEAAAGILAVDPDLSRLFLAATKAVE